MFEILLISIGLVLIIEGILYFLLANKLNNLILKLKEVKPQMIKTISLSVAFFGICLIYFTFKYYAHIK